jgi:hypothetical protein
VSDRGRTKMFARYSLIGALASGVGALAASVPDFLREFDIQQVAAIKLMFVLYAALGILGGLIYRLIPVRPRTLTVEGASVLGPSRNIVYRLATLFSLDAFAGGFVVQSLLALWLFQRFELPASSSSGRAYFRPSHFRWQRGYQNASGS